MVDNPVENNASTLVTPNPIPAAFRNLPGFVRELLANTPLGASDADSDGLPDSVELIIGTDPFNPDSDFDRLNDSCEACGGTDPNKPDSNNDRFPDYHEVTGAPLDNDGDGVPNLQDSLDIDGDGLPNAWDPDNDNDVVPDYLDFSPFAKTALDSSFHVGISGIGHPTYVSFELRPENPDHMRLIRQSWDWPADYESSFMDVDGSVDDLRIIPSLRIDCENLPPNESLIDYGITVVDSSAYVPLVPVCDYGDIVALKGRMFFPASRHSFISLDASLTWQVIGMDDEYLVTAFAVNGHYLSVQQNGMVLAIGDSIGANEIFLVRPMGGNKATLQAANGLYLTLYRDGRMYTSSQSTLFTLSDFRSTSLLFLGVKDYMGDVPILANPDGTLTTNESTFSGGGLFGGGFKWEYGGSLFMAVNLDVVSIPTLLVTYHEDFTITGLSVTQNFGTDIGVFNGTNSTELVAANLLLAYDFLRNSSNDLNDVPDLLNNCSLTSISHNIQSFSHQDLALQAAASSMIPAAVESIPPGATLPIIVAIEDSSAVVELSELSDECIVNVPLSFNLASEPVIVSKVLRTSWYVGNDEIDNNTPLELCQVIDEVRNWGLTDNSDFQTTVGFVAAWYCGECVVASVGGVRTDVSFPEAEAAISFAQTIVDWGLKGIKCILWGIGFLQSAYACAQTIADFGGLFGTAWIIVEYGCAFEEFFTAAGYCSTILEIWPAISKALSIIATILAYGMAVYTVWVIGEELGWGPYGVGIATTVASIKLMYSLLLIAISFIPYGAIVSIALVVIDWFLKQWDIDWMDLLITWLIDRFAAVRQRSSGNLQHVNSSMYIDDLDKNGLTVGDHIGYISNIFGIVELTPDAHSNDREQSFIRPNQLLAYPWALNMDGAQMTTAISSTVSSSGGWEWDATLYNTYAWVSPGIPMANFAVKPGMWTEYRMFYEECWGDDCERKEQTSNWGVGVQYGTEVYFDVMPGSLHGFCNWKGVPSSDCDGDGINNSMEATNGTSEWMWDTDGDGLGDSYEVMIGTDPCDSDSDDDGLNDKFEHQRMFNPLSVDSDSDGLDDFFEWCGWVVEIPFETPLGTKTYYWMVNSDPDVADTDGDGINDLVEYCCYLNPRSPDTDGDGVPDDSKEAYITQFECFKSLTSDKCGANDNFTCVAVDEDGYVYGFIRKGSGSIYPIVIFDPKGDEIGGFTAKDLAEELDCLTTPVLFGRPETRIFVRTSYSYPEDCAPILIYSKEGKLLGSVNMTEINPDPTLHNRCLGIALDPKGPSPYTYCMYAVDEFHHVNKVIMRGTTIVQTEWTGWNCTGPIEVDQDGNVFVSYLDPSGFQRVRMYLRNGTLAGEWGDVPDADYFGVLNTITADADGNILTLDQPDQGYPRIQKWSPVGREMLIRDGIPGEYLSGGFDVGCRNYIYVSEHQNISIYRQNLVPLPPDFTFVDADGDGLTDVEETAGRVIRVITKSGISISTVTSDPLAPDTDFDGVNDAEEALLLSHPRSIDSDGDGHSDPDELALGRNMTLTCWDIDGDGLGDGVEVGFGSDPENQDSDGDGLSDYQEFEIGSDPNSNDTDQDGLDDMTEVGYGADPKNPDSDNDFMFDGQEFALGTDPNSNDTDSDGVKDGYEVLYGTNATSGDTDGDGLSDGSEISSHMNPLSKDTDGDGVDDPTELERGLNPKSQDSDGDMVPDSLDQDYLLKLDGEIILCYDDNSSGAEGFAASLSNQATVRVVESDELLASHKTARYIVLVGDPNGTYGTAGGVIGDLLQNSGEVRQLMKESVHHRIAVRYGAWNATQTIVMLSKVFDTDWIRVIGILRSMRMTISENAVLVEYMNPRACFLLDQEDVIKTTDTYVWTRLDNMTTFKVSVEKLTDDEMTPSLADSDALLPGEAIMNKYVRIEFQPNPSTTATPLGTQIQVYYTLADLDLNGDGDTNDPGDLNESSLSLFVISDDGSWVRLSDIVNATGVNTTDVVMFGKQYAGYVWAKVSGLFPLLGIAGSTNERPSEPGTPWLLVLLVAVVAIVLIAAAIVILRIRRKREPPEDEGPGS